MTLDAAPTDVLAVWTGAHLAEDLIRAGEALAGLPAVANHVVMVTHLDELGRWMGIEGRPGGVGPVDCTRYLEDPRTRSNHDQPRDHGKDDAAVLASAAKSLGLAYDWVGIAEDAVDDLHLADLGDLIDHLWRWPGSERRELPGHVVCSSLAAELYSLAGWAHPCPPAHDRVCQPANWWNWSDRQLWKD